MQINILMHILVYQISVGLARGKRKDREELGVRSEELERESIVNSQ